MGFLNRLRQRAEPRTSEFSVSPGAITAATGFARDLRARTGAQAQFEIIAVTIDARKSGADVTITRGSKVQVVKAGAADRFQPGGIFESYSIAVSADVADGAVRFIEHGVYHEDLAGAGGGSGAF